MAQTLTRTGEAWHLANRLMYGGRPGDLQLIETIGGRMFIERQLYPESIDDTQCEALLAPLRAETLGESTTQLWDRRYDKDNGIKYKPRDQIRVATMLRRIYSQRQLLERTTHFWHDHFSVNINTEDTTRVLWPTWDRALREHALGNFRQLLDVTSHHPCMLRYLDNYVSTNSGPNENYARELLELHTLGAMHYQVEGGYRDDDVYEVSRCFTGWSYYRDKDDAHRGQFKYEHTRHDRFQKVVLGKRIPRDLGHEVDGNMVLDILAEHPCTARHIATKLCQRFVSETPSEALVESAAEVFHRENKAPDQIRRTLAHIFNRPEFMESRDALYKSPQDWAVSTLRALEFTHPVGSDHRLGYRLGRLGHELFEWPSPDGAPVGREYWATSNNLMWRWRMITDLAAGHEKGRGIDFDGLGTTPKNLKTARQLAQFWGERVLGPKLKPETLEGLMAFAAGGHEPDEELPDGDRRHRVPALAALCTMTPEFMRS